MLRSYYPKRDLVNAHATRHRNPGHLSDHEGIANIYSCDVRGESIARHTHEAEYYVRFPSTDGSRIVYSAGGAIAIVIADTLARTVVAPTELPVGAMTALAGAPVFIYLMRRKVR